MSCLRSASDRYIRVSVPHVPRHGGKGSAETNGLVCLLTYVRLMPHTTY